MNQAPELTPPIVIDSGPNPSASVIWLHGLGADGHDFEPIVPELRLTPDQAVRFIFPNAPFRPVTWNNGYVMRAWYDIAMTDRGFYQNVEHLREAEASVHELIATERDRGIDSTRIVLAGFSQGGAVVAHAGLHYSSALAGIMCLSAPIPYLDPLLESVETANAGTSIFLAHGEHDMVVPFALAQQGYERLVGAGLRVEWHRYAVDHGVCAPEIADIAAWLRRVLGDAS